MPIPVLTSGPEEVQTVPTAEDTPIPTISVTKPPAPMPVDLPTEHDIVPVDAAYTHGDREQDLEAGEGMMIQEIEHKVEIVTVSRTPPARTSPMLANSEFTEDAVLVPLPDQGDSSPRSSVEHVGDVDLLSDEGVVLQTPISRRKPSDHEHSSSSGSSPEELVKSSESGEEEAPPENTIRLVGSGGAQGEPEDTTVTDQPEPEEDNDLVEIQPVQPVALKDSKKPKKGKHKKEKSNVSKMLGGKRKKDSMSNATTAAV